MAQSDPGGLWVTAFGYPTTAMLAAVLEELRPPGGALVQHRLGVGPWVHLQYSDWRQQQQALTKNGKVVQGVMIGVIAGIVPSSDILDLPSAPAGVGNLPLRVQHQRIGGPVLRAAAVGHRDLATTGWWTWRFPRLPFLVSLAPSLDLSVASSSEVAMRGVPLVARLDR